MLKHYLESKPYIFRIIVPLTIVVFLSGGSLYYWKSTSVRLTADEKTRRIFTNAKDIREFIEKEHVPLGFNDILTPSYDTPIGHRTAVKITRVTFENAVEVSSAAPVVTWQNRNRDNLRRVLVQRGYTAVRIRKTQIMKHDGIEV